MCLLLLRSICSCGRVFCCWCVVVCCMVMCLIRRCLLRWSGLWICLDVLLGNLFVLVLFGCFGWLDV